MTSLGQIKRNRVPGKEGRKRSRRDNPLVENVEFLTETVKRLKEKNERLAERVDRLEELAKKTSTTEGKTYRANSVLHLKRVN